MDTRIRGQPLYNGQTACPLPLTVHTFLPLTKGQPPNNGQNARPKRVHYSEVPLYMCIPATCILLIYMLMIVLCMVLGDSERTLNLPISYMCDRHTISLPKSQSGTQV